MFINNTGKLISANKKLSKNDKTYYQLELIDEVFNVVNAFCDEQTYIKAVDIGNMQDVSIIYEIYRDRYYTLNIKLQTIERVQKQ